MLSSALAAMAHDVSPADVQAIADRLHGYVAADIAGLCQQAAMAALRRFAMQTAPQSNIEPLLVTAKDLASAAAVLKPSALREVAVEVPQVCE